MIIPLSKHPALNEQNYVSVDKFKEVSQEEFICYETNSVLLIKEVQCEIQILKFSQNIYNWYQIMLKWKHTKIQKLKQIG